MTIYRRAEGPEALPEFDKIVDLVARAVERSDGTACLSFNQSGDVVGLFSSLAADMPPSWSTAAEVADLNEALDALVAASPEFRARMFIACAKRIVALLAVAEELSVHRLDIKLARCLLEHAAEPPSPTDLSVELGTDEEVVTLLLQEFEKRGWIYVYPEVIEIIDPDALRWLTAIREQTPRG